MDDERIKSGGSILTEQYFEEQLQRVREIRLSEHNFYQKINYIYATSVDYDVTAKPPSAFSPPCRTSCTGPSTARRRWKTCDKLATRLVTMNCDNAMTRAVTSYWARLRQQKGIL
jgi:hypothetical protein